MYPKFWEKVTCRDWCEDEDRIWMCLRNKNAICEIEKKSKATRTLGCFPHNALGETDLSLSVVKSGEYIVFCPFKANDIAILKVTTERLEFIDIRNYINKGRHIDAETGKFYRMAVYSNYIFFFGIKYPAIMRLDLMTKRVDFFDGWLEKFAGHVQSGMIFFTDGYARKRNDIYLPLGRCSEILKVNMDSMDYEYMELGFGVCGILGMTQWNHDVWLTAQDTEARKFFQWNLDSGQILEIGLPDKDAFYAPLYYRKSLLFFQNYGKKSYRYELETGKWENITDRMPEASGSSDKKVRGEEITYFSEKGRFHHWNPQTDDIYFDEFKIEDVNFLESSWESYFEKCKREGIKESKLSLENYLGVVELSRIYMLEERKDADDFAFLEKSKIGIGGYIWNQLKTKER